MLNCRTTTILSILMVSAACVPNPLEEVICTDGTRGCACLAGDLPCLDADLTCNANLICVDAPCLAGAADCECRRQGPACDGELSCRDNICQNEPGRAGGTCFEGKRCAEGYGCKDNVCAACAVGEHLCQCYTSGGCDGGLACVGGLCLSQPSEVQVQPQNPRCYTPCTASLQDPTSEFRSCPPGGLMPGCLGTLTCVDGNCIAEGGQPATCAADGDCADFQACLEGTCMANCEGNDDCSMGLQCYHKVCSIPCRTDGDQCSSAQTCLSNDGLSGFCVPLITGDVSPTPEVPGGYIVDLATVQFSNMSTRAVVTVSNTGDRPIDITLSKKYERRESELGLVDYITDSPLPWLRFAAEGSCSGASETDFLSVLLDPEGSARMEICNAEQAAAPAWQGALVITSPGLATREIDVAYTERPDGRWQGRMVYLANFEDQGIDEWVAAGRRDGAELDSVKNALLRRWADFKAGRIALAELWAVLQATETGSWRWPSVQSICDGASPGGACYLYDNIDGFSTYSTSQQALPVPSGIVELPFAINIQQTGGPGPDDDSCGVTSFDGRIVSAGTLHFPGDPALQLRLGGLNPNCARRALTTGLVDVLELSGVAHMGGRYQPSGSQCDTAFGAQRTPWLVPGFVHGTRTDSGGERSKVECRSRLLPFGDDADSLPLNLSLAAANPIPDGRARRQSLQLIDGALLDGGTMLIFFKENHEGFSGTASEDFSAYGYMVLQRQAIDLEPGDFKGSAPQYTETTASKLGVSCTPDLLDEALGAGVPLDTNTAQQAVEKLLRGPGDGLAKPIAEDSTEKVHYLCAQGESQSTFDGNVECPVDASIIYFTATDIAATVVTSAPCNTSGTCSATLRQWTNSGFAKVRVDPLWRCEDTSASVCSRDRLDLRVGKVFFEAGAATALLPTSTLIDTAFAYKARFRSRAKLNVGFTPEVCEQTGDGIPYCYDPVLVEGIEDRVDCALHIFSDPALVAGLNLATQLSLKSFLTGNFARTQRLDSRTGVLTPEEGFDHLKAELLIMLGDDSFTDAFASRFDLAGTSAYGFEGSKFEPGGTDLAGAAGYEMFRLYQAGQYYQMVLDRFYALSEHFGSEAGQSFISLDAVNSYFGRLVRASTQKARTWSEIAERYQRLNQPALAKRVVERSYTATITESTLLTQLMRRVLDNAAPEQAAQITANIDAAQRAYQGALLRMRNVYSGLGGGANRFGYAPDYVPFPALGPSDRHAFARVKQRAEQKLKLAVERENQALASTRGYETDSANFQNELVRIRTTFDNQLAGICGTFEGTDGGVYPATITYAALSEATAAVGDPCGFVGTGGLYEARLAVALSGLDIEAVRRQFDNIQAEIDIERERVREQCALGEEQIAFRLGQDNKANSLQALIDRARQSVDRQRLSYQKAAAGSAVAASCTPTISFTGASLNLGACAGAIGAYSSAAQTGKSINASEDEIRQKQHQLTQLQQASMRWELSRQCDTAEVDSKARVRALALRVAEIEIAALRVGYQTRLAEAQAQALLNNVKRILAEQAEAEQMSINLEAARNDPNVRIYKNDAILAADRTFEGAVREAYRLTRIYEYTTSQSYAELGQLYTVRMAARGEPSLEAYLYDLFDSFAQFEERYGNPDTRVAIVSMRDDVLRIPRLSGSGEAIPHNQRVQLFREQLQSTRLLDGRGYLNAPFSIRSDTVSPLTRNHKVKHIEVEVIGSNIGDNLGRIYLTQAGTSSVQAVDGTTQFHAFPKRTAVMDIFFNGQKVLAPEVYRNDRLRDRPLFNTRWEIVLNKRDESVNQDIDVSSLSDIRLIIYYTDFTEL